MLLLPDLGVSLQPFAALSMYPFAMLAGVAYMLSRRH